MKIRAMYFKFKVGLYQKEVEAGKVDGLEDLMAA